MTVSKLSKAFQKPNFKAALEFITKKKAQDGIVSEAGPVGEADAGNYDTARFRYQYSYANEVQHHVYEALSHKQLTRAEGYVDKGKADITDKA